MNSIDCKELVERLRTVEEQQTFLLPPVSQYVLQHIYAPLLHGKQVLFSDLDFTAFDDDDLNVLEEYVSCSVHNTSQLEELNDVFCRSKPVSLTRRAFC